MIDGARRVGKSFIVEEFAKAEYRSHIIVDFGQASQDVLDLFINDTLDFDLFFAKLSAFYSTTLYKRESLIVFDEVQQFPRARQLIKYFVKDGRFDFIETGSLIRLKKNVQDIIIPSVNGGLFEVGNVDQLAHMMEKFIENPFDFRSSKEIEVKNSISKLYEENYWLFYFRNNS